VSGHHPWPPPREGRKSGQEIRDALPRPDCALGYTDAQVREILAANERAFPDFARWMWGQTMAICEGTTPYYTACAEAHGTIIYRHDLERYLAGLPVID
jgi:hypothetical protein